MKIAELRATYGDDMIVSAASAIADERFTRQGEGIDVVDAACDYFRERLRPLQREVFIVAFLDNRHRPITCEAMFSGTVDAAAVYPREVAKRALEHNAAAVILGHNHPSGIADPSSADISITDNVRSGLALFNIRVLDHIVVGAAQTISLAEQGHV